MRPYYLRKTMFRNRSFLVKVVKDDPQTEETSPLMDAINNMTPAQLDKLKNDLMTQIAFRIGCVILAKVALTIVLKAIIKKLETENE